MPGKRPAPSPPPGEQASELYQAIGGALVCRKLSEAFYARVARDPLLRPLFPGKSFRCAIEAFAAFLAQFLNGPSQEAHSRWWLSLRESHLRFKIGPQERDAWMNNMIHALEDAQIGEPVRGILRSLFEKSSAYLVNQGQVPLVVKDSVTKEPPYCGMHQEIARRWDAQCALDEAVAAIRSGDADRAIALAESSKLLVCDRAVIAHLLALMIAGGHGALLAYVQARLEHDPALAHQPYAGRTLLHAASAAGSLTIVDLLLRLGANPNVTDGGGHAPLYSLGNECSAPGSGSVVAALVRAGANVNANGGVKNCTALHMAARRGHCEAARALLDCGAAIEARDSLGDTPLRRAVNCDKTEVASLLISRGADPHSSGSKRLTPLLAARSPRMKQLLSRDLLTP